MTVSLARIGQITMGILKIFNNIEKEFELFVQTFFMKCRIAYPKKAKSFIVD